MGANELGGTGLLMTIVLIAAFFFMPRMAIAAVAVFTFPVIGGGLGLWLGAQIISNELGSLIGLGVGVVVGWKTAFFLGEVLNKSSEDKDASE